MTSETPSADRRALVTGVTGQDGYYLARLLVAHGWRVTGGVGRGDRAVARETAPGGIELAELELTEAASVEAVVRDLRPLGIFHLAAQSHVPTSWEKPSETTDVNVLGTVRMIEAMRRWTPEAHLVLAGSADCYDQAAAPATGLTAETPMLARTPYAISKLAAMELARRLRESEGLRVSIAILMNHTSPRRPPRFVERKIIRDAVAVARGEREFMTLGNAKSQRDWSWAEDIVEGMRLMGEQIAPGDYVLGSGELRTTGDWVRLAFSRLRLDETRHLRIDPTLAHTVDPPRMRADIRAARDKLGWEPRVDFETMVERMIEAEMGTKA